MKMPLILVVLAVIALNGWGADIDRSGPFESGEKFKPRNVVDNAVLRGLRKRGIKPANICSDQVFLRRVYMDVIGTQPEPAEALAFLEDSRPDKRALLIDDLLSRDEYADYWSLRWCDILRVKAEFPINLWPNAVQCYHKWIRDAVRDNMPFDRFARDLLTATGSNFRVPPVNFCRAIQGRDPATLAQAAVLAFMGSRLDGWEAERREGTIAFFSRVSFKKTREWKEEVVFLTPAPEGPLDAVFPDGAKVRIGANEDPRQVFANWLITPSNPWFTRSAANRVWAWLMGRGVVHEPDDFREDNPPSNPELLDCLAKELVLSRYDMRHLCRVILNSATYQQSSIPRSSSPNVTRLFGHYIVRRLDAEVLIDALGKITGTGEKYMSAIPEPFTFIPEEQRSIALADGSITSPFLEMFGRPARDTGLSSERSNRPTDAQRRHLLNSRDIQQRIERSPKLGKLLAGMRGRPREAIRMIYLTILSRPPTKNEIAIAESYPQKAKLDPRRAVHDLIWALINTKEFLYRH